MRATETNPQRSQPSTVEQAVSVEETNTGRETGPQDAQVHLPFTLPYTRMHTYACTHTHAHTNTHARACCYHMSRKQSMVERSTSGFNPSLSLSKFLKSELNYPISSILCGNHKQSHNNIAISDLTWSLIFPGAFPAQPTVWYVSRFPPCDRGCPVRP